MATGQNDLYAALIGEGPTSAEKQAALADLLRRRMGLAQVAQLSGDPTLAPLGQQQAQETNQQAAQLGRGAQFQQAQQAEQAQRAQQMQFQQAQEARQAAAQQEQMALTRRGQDLDYKSALANTMARLNAAENKPAAQPTESERKNATLATRLEGALRELETIGTEEQKPGLMERGLESAGLESMANLSRSESRQRANAAQLDALDAALTLGTGATYTKEQLANFKTQYFPQVNDKPATIREKAARFKQIVDAAKLAAGRAAPVVDTVLGSKQPVKRVKVDAQGNVIGN
jgi:hypothetical protein